MENIPIVYNDRDTVLHRRDPRAKLLAFAALMALVYVAPNWKWMLGFTILSIGLMVIARVPPKWVGVLWLLQVPNLLGILVFPALQRLFVGQPPLAGSFDFGLKLAFAWSAALFLGAATFTTMRITEIADGMRGLGIPEFVCFAIEYMFLLFYVVLTDIYRVASALRLKGGDLDTKNPIRLARELPNLGVPAIFAVLRRSKTMMAVLKMRG
ncbi:MAG: energy-coupling factor transporter transmembrane protein EcfT, partial [Halobacteriaceae archaeon]